MNATTDRSFFKPAEQEGKTGDREGAPTSPPQGTASWLKESILGLPRRLLGSSPPPAQNKPPIFYREVELKVVGEGDWVVLESTSSGSLSGESVDMSSSTATSSVPETNGGRSRQQLHSGSQNGGGSGLTPVPLRKKTSTSSKSRTSTPPLGPRINSVSSKSQKSARPSSPHTGSTPSSPLTVSAPPTALSGATHSPVQRKVSGKTARPLNLEVQNGGGGASVRSASPSVRSSSPPTPPTRSGGKGGEGKGDVKGGGGKGGAVGGTQRTSSPNLSTVQSSGYGSAGGVLRSSKKKGILVTNNTDGSAVSLTNHNAPSHPVSSGAGSANGPQPSSHGNGHGQPNGNSKVLPVLTVAKPKENGMAITENAEKEEPGASAFEKVRDTLRISRPKKKKKGKKLAYSIIVDPSQISTPEINLHDPGKYQDPFETSYSENGEPEKKVDHNFKPASIPHNKPEYCDHCGDMAWGLYRQVLKCSSK